MWIVFAATLAGLVRGFSGFGSALIYLPIAGQFLSPVETLVTLVFMDSLSPLPILPRVMREADWPDLRRLLTALILFMPLGLWGLLSMSPDVFRWGVSGVSLILLTALVFGLRYQGRLSPGKVYGVGAASGILGGAVGIPGPPVIFFYMASSHAPNVIRATTMLFLVSFDFLLMGMFAVTGVLTLSGLVLGLALTVPMLVGILFGTWLFHPKHEKVYRAAAYVIIGGSALRGLPIWG